MNREVLKFKIMQLRCMNCKLKISHIQLSENQVCWKAAPMKVIALTVLLLLNLVLFLSQVVWECNLNRWYTPSKAKY